MTQRTFSVEYKCKGSYIVKRLQRHLLSHSDLKYYPFDCNPFCCANSQLFSHSSSSSSSLDLRFSTGYMSMEDIVNLRQFEELARQILPKMYYDFFKGGAEDEFTLRENVEAFQRIMIRPRILVDVRNINMSTTLLGYTLSAPILVAPTGMQKLAHPDGEVATARAAAACDTIMVVSFSANCTIEEIASSCNAVRFFQLYMFRRRDVAARIVKRAEISGYKAIVLTVDTPRLGRREADIKNKMIVPKLPNFELLPLDIDSKDGSGIAALASEAMDTSLSWKDIGWLKSITHLPILVKGILTAEDARKAVEAGVSGIIVSNHGARQLDYSPSPISVLEEIVLAVAKAVPVLVDGGIRRGTDVYKALALGADAVMIGRPVVFGLAANGEKGVGKVIEMLKNELELTMALAGSPTVKDITRNHIKNHGDRQRSLL